MRLKFLDPYSKEEREAISERAWTEAKSELEGLGAKHWLSVARYLLAKMHVRRIIHTRRDQWRHEALKQIDERLAALEGGGTAQENPAPDFAGATAFCGAWQDDTHYFKGDVVRHRAAHWVATRDVFGRPPHKSKAFRKIGRVE